MLRLYTFGGLRIERDGLLLQLPTQKTRDLLAYLITFRDRPHPRSVLAGTLWPDLSEEKARRRLSDTLWRVRRVLRDHVLADDECIWFNADLSCWLDIEHFQASTSDLAFETSNQESLENTLDLYRGPFLDGFYDDWALLERERLRNLFLGTLAHFLERHKQTGDYAAALSIAQRIAIAEPLHEAGHRELMCLYHLLDRDAEAIAQYHRCREILREELNVTPAPETEALYQELSLRTAALPKVPAAHLPAPARRPDIDLGELPLVGRDAERSALLNHLETAAAGQGGIVLVEGEPGIGKTRLAQELVSGARWRDIEATLVNASEVATGPYAVLVAALTAVLTPLRVRQITHLVESRDLQAVAPLLPFLGQAMPELPALPELPPADARRRVQQSLIALVLGLARIVPCLWVLEDLQWADAETLAFLTLLRPRLTECRLLLLITARSAELRASSLAWETLQALDRAAPLQRHSLTRLDVGAIAQLVRQLLNEDNPALTDSLSRESAGVPLYLVETLKAWRDEACLLPDERGGWRWREDVPTAPPSHIGEAVIGHRLSRLSPAAEEVLAAAAVIGAEVDFDLLAYICALPKSTPNVIGPDGYLLATDDLLHLGFLAETNVGYRFSHEQVRQAVYHRLPSKKRQALHQAITQALKDLSPDEYEMLAHHSLAAGEREPAIEYLSLAAERSREHFAHQATLSLYESMLNLLTQPDDRLARLDTLNKRAEVLRWVGDREAEGCDLEEMLGLASALSDDCRLARVLRQRSQWHRLQGRYKLAREDASAALDIYSRLADDHGRATALTELALNTRYSDDWHQAKVYCQEALPIYQAAGDLEGQITCMIELAVAAQRDGHYSRQLAHCKRGLALARALGSPHWISHMASTVGWSYIHLGDMDAAEVYLNEALDLAEAIGDKRRQATTLIRLAWAADERGDDETTKIHAQAALAICREIQDPYRKAQAREILGCVALRQGDPLAAKEALEAVVNGYEGIGTSEFAVSERSYLALAELAVGNIDAAWRMSCKVVAKANEQWSGSERCPFVYYNHYLVAKGTHHWAAARAVLEEAAAVLDERVKKIADPAWREEYISGHRFNRDITSAAADLPSPGQLHVSLARIGTGAHHHPAPEEAVTVIWTVDAGEPDAALAERDGKVALRRHRILRLLAEAEEAGGTPTVADLAGALDVSPRTIDSDLAALRGQGHPVRTRGRRA